MPIQKSEKLVEIKARGKSYFAQRRYLSAFGGSGKLVIYGWARSMVLSRGRKNRSAASVRKHA
jgi:hypothetical protein